MRILFTWELGDGIGHVAPYIRLIRRLEELGHEVFFSMRYIEHAKTFFKDTKVTILQTPHIQQYRDSIIPYIDSYGVTMNNFGYHNSSFIESLLCVWFNMLDMVKPDLMVCDFSPSALLAARCRGIKTVRIGSSFLSPTNTYPMPNIFIMQGARYVEPEYITIENAVTKNINTALENLCYPPIKQLGDIFDADKTITMGFLESDHMVIPDGREYYGIIRGSGSEQIEWPISEDPNSPKIFVYSRQCETLTTLLLFFKKQNYRVIVRDNILDKGYKQLFQCENIVFTSELLNFERLGQEADLCVTNGNYTTVIEFLLSGCKLLMLPTHGEQTIVSLRLDKGGFGKMFLDQRDEKVKIIDILHTLLHDKQTEENVKAFAAKYKHLTQNVVIENIINEILR